MKKWEILYAVPNTPIETIEAARVELGTEWVTLYDDTSNTIWAAPTRVVLSVKVAATSAP